MDQKSYWTRVKKLLKQQGKTIQNMAEFCDRPLGTIYGWISKGIYPYLEEALLISRFLGVNMEYLLTGKSEIQKSEIKNIRSLLREAHERLARV